MATWLEVRVEIVQDTGTIKEVGPSISKLFKAWVQQELGFICEDPDVQVRFDTEPTFLQRQILEPRPPCALALEALERDAVCPACKNWVRDHKNWVRAQAKKKK